MSELAMLFQKQQGIGGRTHEYNHLGTISSESKLGDLLTNQQTAALSRVLERQVTVHDNYLYLSSEFEGSGGSQQP